MKRMALLLMFIAAAAFAQEDSPLVKAAKASGGKRKPTTKVITNADLKKSKGKLAVMPAKTDAAKPAAAVDTRGPLEKQDDDRRALDAANARVSAAQKKFDDLQKQLQQIEDAYYAENDPNYRDSTIVQKFNDTKQKVAGARKDLAEARDAQTKLKP